MTTELLTREKPIQAPPDDDLVHVTCTPCRKRARQRARRVVAYCGKTMPLNLREDPGTLPVCVVCVEMATHQPCIRCGTQAVL